MEAREELELLLSQRKIWEELFVSEAWKEYERELRSAVRANRQLDGRLHIVTMDSAFQSASLRGVIQGQQDALDIPVHLLADLEGQILQLQQEIEIEEEQDNE